MRASCPVGWARVIWGPCQPFTDLELVLAGARERVRRPSGWSRCSGPTQAYVLTCLRLGWGPLDACRVKLDDGRALDYRLVPPCIVGVEVRMAVQRWTWRHVAATLGEPGFADGGVPRGCLRGAAACALFVWPAEQPYQCHRWRHSNSGPGQRDPGGQGGETPGDQPALSYLPSIPWPVVRPYVVAA